MAVGLRIGRYQLGERLGTGGFGVVYHARDTELGRELAIKVLRPEYQTQPDVIARFLKEARAAAKIDHPGIVTVFECGTITNSGTAQDGNAYIAMELLRGHSLSQHIERKGRIPAVDAILVARQVASALAVAHAAGIVHRDLKPDNIFLLPDPLIKGGFRIKVLDFGVAKLAEPKEVGVNTHSQMMLGTPKYMSPEQARSARAVDARTDIYTLGCMLYEMLTALPPYEGPGAIDLIIQHTTSPVPSPAAIVSGLPPALDMIVRSMLGKEPDERPESMIVLDQQLGQILAQLAPPSVPPREKPTTSPPPIPQTPARPSHPRAAQSGPLPRQSQPVMPSARPSVRQLDPPSGLTPTPAVTITRADRMLDSGEQVQVPTLPRQMPARPSPMPPAAVAVGTVSEPSVMPRPAFPPDLDDEVATELEPRTTRNTGSGRPVLLIGAFVVAAALAAGIVWIALRDKPPATAPVSKQSVTPATKLDADAVKKLRQDCADFQRTQYWKELEECAERLAPYDLTLSATYKQTASDEAANELKWKGVQDDLTKHDVEAARVLVKRIGDKSVYTERAHKALADAEAKP